MVQRIFKKNAGNITSDSEGVLKIRPSDMKEPILSKITDFIIATFITTFHYFFMWEVTIGT
jgi:hypothetical protein